MAHTEDPMPHFIDKDKMKKAVWISDWIGRSCNVTVFMVVVHGHVMDVSPSLSVTLTVPFFTAAGTVYHNRLLDGVKTFHSEYKYKVK